MARSIDTSGLQLGHDTARFAGDNGLVVLEALDTSGRAGMIFGYGGERRTETVFRSGSQHPIPFEVGYHSARRPDMKQASNTPNYGREGWTYVALTIDRRLPRMVLDARRNDGVVRSSLPEVLADSQRLSLEGDFDRHFTLYAPASYERDALYVFTPDLMALLIDNAAVFDIETVDDQIIFFTKERLPLDDPAVWQQISELLDTVGAKFSSQTARYADARVADARSNTIAPVGRRLKRSRRVIFNLILAAVLLTGLALLVPPMLALLFG